MRVYSAEDLQCDALVAAGVDGREVAKTGWGCRRQLDPAPPRGNQTQRSSGTALVCAVLPGKQVAAGAQMQDSESLAVRKHYRHT